MLVRLLLLAITGRILYCHVISEEDHWIRCIINISVHYFNPRQRLAMLTMPHSATHEGHDIETKLSSKIHELNIWPVISYPCDKHSIKNITEKFGIYIILVPGKCEDSAVDLFRCFSYFASWTPESRFIVAVTGQCNKYYSDLMLIKIFWRYRLTNVVLLLKKFTSSKHITTFGKPHANTFLGAYSLYPYDGSRCHIGGMNIVRLDSWMLNNEGYFLRNEDLFPTKIGKNLHGCPLIVHLANELFIIDIHALEFITSKMNITKRFVTNKATESRFDKLLKVYQGKADIMLGRINEVDCLNLGTKASNSFHFDELYIYVPCSLKYPRWSGIFRMFTFDIWVCLFSAMAFASLTMKVMARFAYRDSDRIAYQSFSSSLTNIWAVVLGVSVSVMPRTLSLRLFFLIWVCFSLAVNVVFQCFLTTYLVEPRYQHPVESIDEIISRNLKICVTPQVKIYMINFDSVLKYNQENIFHDVAHGKDCVNMAVAHENVSLVLSNLFVNTIHSVGLHRDENEKLKYCKLDNKVLFFSHLSLCMSHGNALIIRMNDIIRRIMESGLYSRWVDDMTSKILWGSRNIPKKEEYYSYSVEHLHVVFYIFLFCIISASVVFICELVVHYYTLWCLR
ncbi:hypothetical protein ANN_00236 [Periplaneta americana]|uniref:Ionotropic glutamate receptor C-terminal domain-containing protein n=1 Tax=Periplaneta americana TaxID=6978 RepID=A0ABQ8TU69_PERAM|nr:hypothetical protein ANN_00236 [Periplaneta americana]